MKESSFLLNRTKPQASRPTTDFQIAPGRVVTAVLVLGLLGLLGFYFGRSNQSEISAPFGSVFFRGGSVIAFDKLALGMLLNHFFTDVLNGFSSSRFSSKRQRF